MTIRSLPGALLSITAASTLLLSCSSGDTASPADLVLRNGIVYTVDPHRSVAEAIVIKSGRIEYVGSDSVSAEYIGQSTRVIDLGRRMVLPGFVDSHCHPTSAYKYYFELTLNGLRSIPEYEKAIRDFALRHPDATFVRGRGWSNTLFAKTGPHRQLLDRIFPSIPVSLSSEDGHSKWVNSKTLEAAGITRLTPDPEGGVIEREPANGEPTGTLREAAADLISGIFPSYTVEELKKGLEAYQSMALRYGITTAHDASVDVPGNEVLAYRALESEGRLRMRFRASMYADPAKGTAQIQLLRKERQRNSGPLFQTNSVKIFLDGVVEGSTAFLKENYKHLKASRGSMLCTQDELNQMCAELQRDSLQIHVHAIGDGATSAALDAFTFAEGRSGKRDARHCITHLQLVDPGDIARFRLLGVVAVPQPYWFMKDDYYYNLQVPYLGKRRADAEYPMESFFKAGVIVASSSDYPVTIPCNPLIGIQNGLRRSKPETSDPRAVLWPEERASLEEMISSFTIHGAYGNFLENQTGSLEAGKSADLIVLDRDLFSTAAIDIRNAKVLLTLFSGKEAFRDSTFAR